MASYAINAQNQGHVIPDTTLFAQVLDRANRADPFPLYARLRETPVIREDDGTYIVSTHAEIRGLLHDQRLSSDDLPKSKHARTGNPLTDFIINPVKDWIIDTHRSLIFCDPPEHTILRRLVMTQFTPERVRAMGGSVDAIVEDLIGRMRGREEIDLVGDFAYPLPVTVICDLLGIPQSDGPKFQGWSRTLAESLDPDRRAREEDRLKRVADYHALANYLSALVKEKRKRPAGDLLSGLATSKDKKLGRMGKYDLIATAVLLLVAGHETTVNLIANGMLTLCAIPNGWNGCARTPRLRHDLSRSCCVSSRRSISARARPWLQSTSSERRFRKAHRSSFCLLPATATRSALHIQTGSIRIAPIIRISASAEARIIVLERRSPGSKPKQRSSR